MVERPSRTEGKQPPGSNARQSNGGGRFDHMPDNSKYWLLDELGQQPVELALRYPGTQPAQVQLSFIINKSQTHIIRLLASAGCTPGAEPDGTGSQRYQAYYSPELLLTPSELPSAPSAASQFQVLDSSETIQTRSGSLKIGPFFRARNLVLSKNQGERQGHLTFELALQLPEELRETGTVNNQAPLTMTATQGRIALADVDIGSTDVSTNEVKLTASTLEVLVAISRLQWPQHPLSSVTGVGRFIFDGARPRIEPATGRPDSMAVRAGLIFSLQRGGAPSEGESFYLPLFRQSDGSQSLEPMPLQGHAKIVTFSKPSTTSQWEHSIRAGSIYPTLYGRDLKMPFDYQMRSLSLSSLLILEMTSLEEISARLAGCSAAKCEARFKVRAPYDKGKLRFEPNLVIERTDNQYLHLPGLSKHFARVEEGACSLLDGQLEITRGDVSLYVPRLDSNAEDRSGRFRFDLKPVGGAGTPVLKWTQAGPSLVAEAVPQSVRVHSEWSIRQVLSENGPGSIVFENGQFVRGEFLIDAPLPGLEGASTQLLMRLEVRDGVAQLAGTQASVDLKALRVPLIGDARLRIQLDRLDVSLKWDTESSRWSSSAVAAGGLYLAPSCQTGDLADLCRPGFLKLTNLNLLDLASNKEVVAQLPEPIGFTTFGGLLNCKVSSWVKLNPKEGTVSFGQASIELRSGAFLMTATIGSQSQDGKGLSIDLNRQTISLPPSLAVDFWIGRHVAGSGQISYTPNMIGLAGAVRTQGFQFSALAKVGRVQRGTQWLPSLVIYGSAPVNLSFPSFSIPVAGGGISINQQLRGLGRSPSAEQILQKIDELDPGKLENWEPVDYGDFFLSIVLTATLTPTLAPGSLTHPWVSKITFSLDTDLRAIGAAKVWFFSSTNFVNGPRRPKPSALAAAALQLGDARFSLAAQTNRDGDIEASNNFVAEVLRTVSVKFSFSASKRHVDYHLQEIHYRANFLGATLDYRESYRFAMVEGELLLKASRNLSGRLGTKRARGSCGWISGSATVDLQLDAGFGLAGLVRPQGVQALADLNLTLRAEGRAAIEVEIEVDTPWKTYTYVESWEFPLGSFSVALQGTLGVSSRGEVGFRGRIQFPLRVPGTRYRTDVDIRFEEGAELVERVQSELGAFEAKLSALGAGFKDATSGALNPVPLQTRTPDVLMNEVWCVFTPPENPRCHIVFPAPTNPWLENITALEYSTNGSSYQPVPTPQRPSPDQITPERALHAFAFETLATNSARLLEVDNTTPVLTDPRYFGDSSPHWRLEDLSTRPTWAPPARLVDPSPDPNVTAPTTKEGLAYQYYDTLRRYLVVSRSTHGVGASDERAFKLRGAFLQQLFQYARRQLSAQGRETPPLLVRSTVRPQWLRITRGGAPTVVPLEPFETLGKDGPVRFHTPCQDLFEDERGRRIELRFPVDVTSMLREGQVPSFAITRTLDGEDVLIARAVSPEVAECTISGQLTLLLSPLLPTGDVIEVDERLERRLLNGRSVTVQYKFTWGGNRTETVAAQLYLPSAPRVPVDLTLIIPSDPIQLKTGFDKIKFSAGDLYRITDEGPRAVELPPLEFFATTEDTGWTGFYGDEVTSPGRSPDTGQSQPELTAPQVESAVRLREDGGVITLSLNRGRRYWLFCRAQAAPPRAPLIPIRPICLHLDLELSKTTRYFAVEALESAPAEAPKQLEISNHSWDDGTSSYQIEWVNDVQPHAGAEVVLRDLHQPDLCFTQRCRVLEPDAFLAATRSLATTAAWTPRWSDAGPVVLTNTDHLAAGATDTRPGVAADPGNYEKLYNVAERPIWTRPEIIFENWETFLKSASESLSLLRTFLRHPEVSSSPKLETLNRLVDLLALQCRCWMVGINVEGKAADQLLESLATLRRLIANVETDREQPTTDPRKLRGRSHAAKILLGRMALASILDRPLDARTLLEDKSSIPAERWPLDEDAGAFKNYRVRAGEGAILTTDAQGNPEGGTIHEIISLAEASGWARSFILANALTRLLTELNKGTSNHPKWTMEPSVPLVPGSQEPELEPFLPDALRASKQTRTSIAEPPSPTLPLDDWVVPSLRLLERLGLSAAVTTKDLGSLSQSVILESVRAALEATSASKIIIIIRPTEPTPAAQGHGFVQVVALDAALDSTAENLKQWLEARGISGSVIPYWAEYKKVLSRLKTSTLQLEASDSEILLPNFLGRSSVSIKVSSPYAHQIEAAVAIIERTARYHSFLKGASAPPTWSQLRFTRLEQIRNRQTLAIPDAGLIRVAAQNKLDETGCSVLRYAYELPDWAIRAHTNAISQQRTGWAGVRLWLEFEPWLKRLPSSSRERLPVFTRGKPASNRAKSTSPIERPMFRAERLLVVRNLTSAFRYRLRANTSRRVSSLSRANTAIEFDDTNDVGSFEEPIATTIPGWLPLVQIDSGDLIVRIGVPRLNDLDDQRERPPLPQALREYLSNPDGALGYRVTFKKDELNIQVCDVLLGYHPSYPPGQEHSGEWKPLVTNLGPWLEQGAATLHQHEATGEMEGQPSFCLNIRLKRGQPPAGYLTGVSTSYRIWVSRPNFPWTEQEGED